MNSSAKKWLIVAVGILSGASLVLTSLALSPASTATNLFVGTDPGGLVNLQMKSQVGVLLDEIPNSERDNVAAIVMSETEDFWTERAQDQIRLMSYRLVYRAAFYDESEGKDALPLPPEQLWNIEFESKPLRTSVNSHDLVLRDFAFTSTLLTDIESPAKSEPNLESIGGKWSEPFILPLDPELVFQRTGFACMDEDQFPRNSVDAEEVATFYDQEMEQDSEGHYSFTPDESCVEALDSSIGKVETELVFERLQWDPKLAENVRVGEITNPTGPDLVIEEDVFRTNRVVYRYVTSDSCSYQEKAVEGTGWRRLLQFAAADRNSGAKTLEIGDIDYFIEGDGTELSNRGIYEFSECHQHYHFKHYGIFSFADSANHKAGFCLQSTNRLSNNEQSPLPNPYAGCSFQGIEVGWVDEYRIGLGNQWVDITEIDTSKASRTEKLSFYSNPHGFLCEGTPSLDAEGNPIYEATEFRTDDGQAVYRQKCDFGPGTLANNFDSYDVTIPADGNGYVTEECTHGEVGPLRNCGFEKLETAVPYNCTPGEQVSLSVSLPEGTYSQIVRVCDYSFALATSIPCTYNGPYNAKSLANAVVSGDSTSEIRFECPAGVDDSEPGGRFSLYSAPLLSDYSVADVKVKLISQ